MDQLNRSSSATPTAVNDYATLAKNGMHVADVIIKFCAKIVSEHQYLNKVRLA
jgi:hypothetical protein